MSVGLSVFWHEWMCKLLVFPVLKIEPGGVKVVKLDQGLLFPAVEYLQECVLEANEAGKSTTQKL